jgi:hypothetical protein
MQADDVHRIQETAEALIIYDINSRRRPSGWPHAREQSGELRSALAKLEGMKA